MSLRRIQVVALTIALVGISSPSTSFAQQQTKDQQKCTAAMNKSLSKVAKTQGKIVSACVKDFAKGNPASPDACLSTDPKGKLAKASSKADADFASKCVGNDKDGQPKLPPYGATDPNTVVDAGVEVTNSLVRDMQDGTLDGRIISEATDKDASKCQQALTKDALKCESAHLKAFEKCKEAGLKDGVITSAAGLQACFGDDPKGKIAKACGTKLSGDITKKCVDKAVTLSTAIPGCATDVAATLHTCLTDAVECRVCQALNSADNLAIACDSCPVACGNNVVEAGEECDDGGTTPGDGCDASCQVEIPTTPIGAHTGELDDLAFCVGGTDDGEPCTDTITNSDCGGAPGTKRCVGNSNAVLNTSFSQPQVVIPLVGGFDVNCDPNNPPDPITGKSVCECKVRDIQNVVISAIGNVCFTASPGCPAGEIDCDGGNLLDLDGVQVHDIGNCGLSDDPNTLATSPGLGNAECTTLCDAHCAGRGPDFSMQESGCEGYCQAGPRVDMGCEVDVDCPTGSCEGADPVAHENTCNCSCLEIGGNPSRAGGLRCMAGVQIVVEIDEPCRIVDGIDDRRIFLPDICVPLTTEVSNGHFEDMDLLNVSVSGGSFTGNPISCQELSTSVTTGMRMHSQIGFYDSALGDLQVVVTVLGK